VLSYHATQRLKSFGRLSAGAQPQHGAHAVDALVGAARPASRSWMDDDGDGPRERGTEELSVIIRHEDIAPVRMPSLALTAD
jgi:hypothetical protein